jgi:hypothetical protein
MGFAAAKQRGHRHGSASSALDALTPNAAHPNVKNLGPKLAMACVVVSLCTVVLC